MRQKLSFTTSPDTIFEQLYGFSARKSFGFKINNGRAKSEVENYIEETSKKTERG